MLSNFLSFLLGLVLTLVVYGSITAALLYHSLANMAQAPTLAAAERQDAFLFYLVLTITVATSHP